MNKSLCKKCYASHDCTWNKNCEDRWKYSYVCCVMKHPDFNSDISWEIGDADGTITTKLTIDDTPPEKCPYILEHMMYE